MNNCLPRFAGTLASVLALFGLLGTTAAAEKIAAELFPQSVVGYVEAPQPKKLLDTVLDHPIVKEVQAHPDVKKALETPQYGEFERVLAAVEAKVGMKWRPAASTLLEGGVYAAFDLPTQGVAVLSRSSDPKLTSKALETLVEVARAEVANRGGNDPVKTDEYHGVTLTQIGEVHYATFGTWLLTTNKPLLLRVIIDNYQGEGTSLAADEQFQSVLKTKPAGATAWLYADLRPVRLLGILKTALNKKSDNPPAEILAGGVLGALPEAPYFTASLNVESSRIALTTGIPCDTLAVAKTREFFFGADGKGEALPLLSPSQTLFSLSTYRDFGSLWRHAPDLFDERVNAQLAEAESGLTTFFAGRNFRDDILGNIEPGLQLVVTRQQFPQAGITPAIKLPAGAIVVKMKKPEETARLFKITYQSLIGFLNVVGGMNGLDPLDLNSERTATGLVVSAEYLPPEKPGAKTDAAIHFNASPTIAVVGDKFIVASSKPLALELAELVQKPASPLTSVNTALRVDGDVLRQVLVDNRSSLVAQNMLQKGHDQAAAEKEIDALNRALQAVEGASASLTAKDKVLELTVELRLTPVK